MEDEKGGEEGRSEWWKWMISLAWRESKTVLPWTPTASHPQEHVDTPLAKSDTTRAKTSKCIWQTTKNGLA